MERNPWDSAVQFKDELITQEVPAGQRLRGHLPVHDRGAGARAALDRHRAARPVHDHLQRQAGLRPSKDAWWLDKAFGEIDIAAARQGGRERRDDQGGAVHDLPRAGAGLRAGRFRLKPADVRVSSIVGGSQADARLSAVGTSRAARSTPPASPTAASSTSPQPAGRYVVELGKWYGSVAEVVVNGKPAGYIACQPWECDVTKFIKAGREHGRGARDRHAQEHARAAPRGTLRGSAWPAMFQKGPETGPPPGDSYHTLGYGLFEPFTLRQLVEE